MQDATDESNWSLLVFVSTVASACAALGIRRSHRVNGRVDLFHPLVFPLVYVSVSFFLPFWVTYALERPVGSLARPYSVADWTPLLLVLGVVAFAAGAALPFRHKVDSKSHLGDAQDRVSRNLIAIGRLIGLVALGLAALALIRGGVEVRGTGQGEYSTLDSLSVATKMAPLTAAVLIVVGHASGPSRAVAAKIDVLLLGSIVVATGLRGTRSAAIAVILVMVMAMINHGKAIRSTVFGIGGAALFMVAVLRYRNEVQGVSTEASFWEILLGDMAPVGFTTGTIAEFVPSTFPFASGSTILAALFRQLPSPIAVRLFGPPDDTGAQVFRQMIGLTNPNQGVGFSLPADGYLNFGILGVMGTCFVIGSMLSWSYARYDLSSTRATGALYLILVAMLPFALRSDYLGSIKSVLYPFMILWVAIILARVALPTRAKGSQPRGPGNVR